MSYVVQFGIPLPGVPEHHGNVDRTRYAGILRRVENVDEEEDKAAQKGRSNGETGVGNHQTKRG